MRTLLNFSGGLDSTYCLWKWLTDNPNETLVVHHCNLMNNQNRYELEQQATHNILKWLVDNKLTNFEYIETTYDIRQIKYRSLDSQVIAFINGTMLISPKYKDLTHTIMCGPKDEYERLGNILQRGHKDNELIRNIPVISYIKNQKRNQLQPIYMVAHMTKTEIYNATPKELRDLSWSCRTPKDNKPCHKCHTCKQLRQVL
jgi:7-cyano-7-deazaguanine synthase in queuosine biosynthesis